MHTITQLARRFGLSRTTLLYYEREGLLQPSHRSDQGYRYYGSEAENQLSRITAFRSYGLPIAQIRSLLNRDDGNEQQRVLTEHFHQLEREIDGLRQQQRAIMAVLQDEQPASSAPMDKARWVAIMQAAGLDEAAMSQWHRHFEQREPEEHQRFLQSLGIPPEEIARIRAL
ncbi:MerR family transcriptional regulator [Ferrimonas marina]|uniref:DNA-binding transcriptional regulator, MerR family n=1 Tax=Ferrimonas marina TaxID=299255 RepID=A0A1M5YTF6_9GAMM|nr:MerR family transcriptional regulator [Ferrimonas marina]SHI15295.1 DNA-binding transcriptional regulator, MerR family [Ferrimonas marina]